MLYFIQVVKYGKRIFISDATVDFLKIKVRGIADTFNVETLEIGCDEDHFRMLFWTILLLNMTLFT